MNPDVLLGYRSAVARDRWHVVRVVQSGGYSLSRPLCGSIEGLAYPGVRTVEAKNAADLPALAAEHLSGRTVCPRCAARVPRAEVAA